MSVMCMMLAVVEGLTCPLPPADPSAALTRPQLYAVLEQAGWPEPLWEEAAGVAWCESAWQPAAHAPGAWHYGLFQINWYDGVNPPLYPGWSDWLREVHGVEAADPLNPVDNARAAWLIYQHSGWINWAYCGSEVGP
jgi:hypothetical protein